MKQRLPTLLRTAEKSVTRLVQACRKLGPRYRQELAAVAEVRRTGKWHLNALAALRRALKTAAGANVGRSR